ncbi:MAG: alpha/beta hydrolase [Bacteroidota bacterium]
MALSKYIQAGSQQLHYLQLGSGPHLLLAFHGYANDAAIFYIFEKHLGKEYTILSFDLPHHGRSRWPDDTLLTKNDLLTLIQKIKHEFSISKVALMGYSMGGRVCLNIIALSPESVDKVVLIAPDGLTPNFYYHFLTRTILGKKMFRHFLTHPERYFKVIDWLRDKKRIDASRHRFAMQYLQSEYTRNFLLRVWPAMSDLIAPSGRVQKAIRKHSLPVAIFMGAYDKIIPPGLAHSFGKGLATVQVHVLQKGHRVFDSDNAAGIAAHLL